MHLLASYHGDMPAVPSVSASSLIDLVNGYGHRPRAAAGESRNPYPDPIEMELPVDRDELIELADRLWTVFGAPEPADRVAALNSLLADAALTPEIDTTGVLRWVTRHERAAALLGAGCASTLLDAVQRHGWSRLGTCDCDDCVDVYLDEHGRTPRRYCSTVCLNRARVRAYRSRKAAGPSR